MKRVLAALCALLLAACAGGAGPAPAPLALAVKPMPLVSGYLRPPAPKAQRRLQSGIADLMAGAFVSLIDAAGDTRASGPVEPDGRFTLMPSTGGFEPQAGTLYTLEAINRIAGAEGGNWGALRTVGRRLPDGTWQSLSGSGPVEISAQTTILARVMDGDPAVTFDVAMGKAAGGALTPFGAYDAVFFAGEEGKLDVAYAGGVDPAGERAYVGNITISQQSDFAQWQDYDAITGSLSIDGSLAPPGDEITAIDLPRLKRVGINLQILNCPALTGLAGLSNLRSIYGLYVNATGLTSFADLRGLRGAKIVQLVNNPALASLQALNGLSLYTFAMENCPLVTQLPSLQAQNAGLYNMAGLSTLAGLSIPDPAGTLYLTQMDGLISLGGLSVGASLYQVTLQSLSHLADTSALDGVTMNSLNVYDAPALTRLPHAELKGALTLQNLPLVSSLQGLRVTSEGSRVNFYGLGALTTLADLQLPATLAGLDVGGCPLLTSLAGVEGLRRIRTTDGTNPSLSIGNNQTLADIGALGGLTSLAGVFVNVSNNPALCFDAAALWPGLTPAVLDVYGNGPCP